MPPGLHTAMSLFTTGGALPPFKFNRQDRLFMDTGNAPSCCAPVFLPLQARWYTGVLTQPVRRIIVLSNMNEIDSLVFEYLRLKHPKGWDCSEADFISEVQRLRAEFAELLNPPQRDIPPGFIG